VLINAGEPFGGWGSTPDPTGGAYSAPPEHHGWWGCPLPTKPTPAPRAFGPRPSAFRALILGPIGLGQQPFEPRRSLPPQSPNLFTIIRRCSDERIRKPSQFDNVFKTVTE